jgi:alpha-galactosidase
MAKVAMIGAGSTVFAKNLIGDILSFEELQDSTIALMDIDAERLSLTERVARRVAADNELPARIEATLDRREALEGADYVIIMIEVGGVPANNLDNDIPLKYGVKQCIGDTLGPGGVFRFLRTWPQLFSICRDVETLCPDAFLLNYSNPMAMNCWALSLATSLRFIGLCHGVVGTAHQIARIIGAPYEELQYWAAGINHMTWFLELRWRGEDAYPLLRQAIEDPEVFAKDRVRFEVMRSTGYFVTESSGHTSEYLPYFRKRDELIEEFGVPTGAYRGYWPKDVARGQDAMQSLLASDEKATIRRSGEYASRILHSLETGTPRRITANVPNTGLIGNLPDGCCVEVPALVDGAGAHPCSVGDLPPVCAALCRSNVNVQELAVKAALEASREHAMQALMVDPLTAAVCSLAEIRALTNEMFEAEREWLPQFQVGG